MRDRVIVELRSSEEAKKVEETVKTGYAETSVENLVQWAAVEEDLAESYGRLAEGSTDGGAKGAYERLQGESRANIVELSRLLKALEELDRARIKRIELLSGLH